MADHADDERLGRAVRRWAERHGVTAATAAIASSRSERDGEPEFADLFDVLATIFRAEEDPSHAGRAFLAGVETLSNETRRAAAEWDGVDE